jgi:FAD dependent oxidoreductase
MQQLHFDVVVVGASVGGVAAALRASALGANVCLLEGSTWIGGQYSSQGLTRGDETEYVNRGIGCTASYQRFRAAAVEYYTKQFTLSAAGKKLAPFDPGAVDANHGTNLRIAPRVAHETMLAMLAAATPRITVTTGMQVTSAQVAGARIAAVVARPFNGAPVRYTASYFLDATDLGELLAIADVPHALGADSKADFGEPDAPPERHKDWIQPITVPLALERRPHGEDHTLPEPPPGYDDIVGQRGFQMSFGKSGVFGIVPYEDSLFNYRQFIAAANFADPALPYDVTTVNDDNNDYTPRSIPTGNPDEDAAIVVAARARSLAYAYWIQTECPRDDGSGRGYPNLRIATEVFGTYDGTAPLPYIRESRRMLARTTIRQQDIVVKGSVRANAFADSVGIGRYRLDMHAVDGMPGYGGDQPSPFQIPWARSCRPRSRTCCPRARISASRTSPTARTACTRSSGTSASPRARSRRSA